MRIIGIIGMMLVASAALGQTQGVSVRATNGVAYGFLSQSGQAGSSNSVSIGGGEAIGQSTNGFDFVNGVNIDVLGTNRLSANAAGIGIYTNAAHALDVVFNTASLSGNTSNTVPAATIYKNSNGANNTQEILALDANISDIPFLLIGRTGDGMDFSWQRNGVVGGDHLLMATEGSVAGLGIYQDGHLEVQNGGNRVLLAGGNVGLNGGLNVGITNTVASGNANIQGTLLVHQGANFTGITSNEVATVGTFGVPTVFGVTNISNTTGSATLGGIGTSPNLAGHSTVCEMMGTVQVSTATAATLTVAFAWTDEAGQAQTTNIVTTAPIAANGDLTLGPLFITSVAGGVCKVSSTLAGTAQYSLHAVALVLVNN